MNRKDLSQKKRIPKYLDKVNGRFVAVYTNQALYKKDLKRGFIHLSGTDIMIKTNIKWELINQVRVVPKNCYYSVEVVYEKEERRLKENNGRYAAIDLGVNNLATVSFNIKEGFIINGKPLKSINQFYNKRLAELKEKASKYGKTSTHKINTLTRKRNNKVKNYIHKAARYIVNHLVSNNINTLIIGKNDNWKQETNIGKRNNQNFNFIPHS